MATPEERKTRQQMEQSETIELVRHYYAIPDPKLRQKFLELVKAASDRHGALSLERVG
jgi:hypothetical protein